MCMLIFRGLLSSLQIQFSFSFGIYIPVEVAPDVNCHVSCLAFIGFTSSNKMLSPYKEYLSVLSSCLEISVSPFEVTWRSGLHALSLPSGRAQACTSESKFTCRSTKLL